MSDNHRYREDHASPPSFTPLEDHRKKLSSEMIALESSSLPTWIKGADAHNEMVRLKEELAACQKVRDELIAALEAADKWIDNADGPDFQIRTLIEEVLEKAKGKTR